MTRADRRPCIPTVSLVLHDHFSGSYKVVVRGQLGATALDAGGPLYV
ncbi:MULTISPECIES: hypothetical protein [unclassified Rhizobium]|nr:MULTISPECIES: hypothetical protein [unclassified Rhizobium]MBO9127517.1 hypothetical protein [Rhizobium sp. 16-488-2b]MBO9177960.1 hypothetical protein [Rhizobium sp. 16-488-2a]